MGLLQAIIWYPLVFIIMICVITGAVILGKKLRDNKDAKNASEQAESTQTEQINE